MDGWLYKYAAVGVDEAQSRTVCISDEKEKNFSKHSCRIYPYMVSEPN